MSLKTDVPLSRKAQTVGGHGLFCLSVSARALDYDALTMVVQL
jgi:hypothetical protein